MDSDMYVVTIQGPKGVKHISLPAGQVRLFAKEHDSDYAAALFLAPLADDVAVDPILRGSGA